MAILRAVSAVDDRRNGMSDAAARRRLVGLVRNVWPHNTIKQ